MFDITPKINPDAVYTLVRRTNAAIIMVEIFGSVRYFSIRTFEPPSESSTAPLNYSKFNGIDITKYVIQNAIVPDATQHISSFNKFLLENEDRRMNIRLSSIDKWFEFK